VGYRIESLPARPRIFDLIQSAGAVDDVEMFRVFNMGVGFVVVVASAAAEGALGVLEGAGYRAQAIGTVTDEQGVVRIEPAGLVGGMAAGESHFSYA
jgi:phosphoribosylaminoimidazole (AIR) synthetase